jgi:hypothetical protein
MPGQALPNDDHRALRKVKHFVSDAAQEQRPDVPNPSGTHHDGIRILLFEFLKDDPDAAAKGGVDLSPGRSRLVLPIDRANRTSRARCGDSPWFRPDPSLASVPGGHLHALTSARVGRPPGSQ